MKYKSEENKTFWFEIMVFVILSYLFTWIYIIPKALHSHTIISFKLPFGFEYLAAFGPALAGMITSYFFEEGKKGVKALLKGMIVWRVHIKWYLFAILLQPFTLLSSLLIQYLFTGYLPSMSEAPIYQMNSEGLPIPLILLLVIYLIIEIILLSGEEIGWRGISLPMLLSKFGWIVASLILSIIWFSWHIPLFFDANEIYTKIPIIGYFLDLVATTLLLTWLYIHTKKSLLLASIFHASINTFQIFIPVLPLNNGSLWPYFYSILMKFIIILVIAFKQKDFRLTKKSPSLNEKM